MQRVSEGSKVLEELRIQLREKRSALTRALSESKKARTAYQGALLRTARKLADRGEIFYPHDVDPIDPRAAGAILAKCYKQIYRQDEPYTLARRRDNNWHYLYLRTERPLANT